MEDEEKYKHSNDFKFAYQLKSWMSLNPSIGCIWDCAYCVQEKDKFFKERRKEVTQIKDEEGIISEVMANPKITSRTPLSFYNFSDPFLPHNTKTLTSTLKELDRREMTNIVGLISRTFADRDTIETIAGLENLNPILLVSYAGYSNEKIERAPESMRVKLAEEFHNRGVPVIQYLRPVAREWLEEDQFKRARDNIVDSIDAVVMSGIRMTPEIEEKLEERGLPIPYTPDHEHKYFSDDLQERILKVYEGTDTPVHRYTSCGVSSIFGIPDYNAHLDFFKVTQGRDYSKCPLPCKEKQSEVCNNADDIEPSKLRKLLNKIGHRDVDFEIKESGRARLDTKISKEDISFLRHNLSRHVHHKGKKHYVDKVAGMRVNSEG